MNQHALALDLNADKEVFVYSPTSTNRLLQTIHTVAGGQTEREIKDALHPSIFQQGKIEYGEGVSTVDALVINNKFKPGINHFQGLVTFQDFNRPDYVESIINDVVRKTTKEKIKTIVAKEDITPDTMLIGFSALYAKLLWEEEMERDGRYRFQGDPTQPMISATSSNYKVLISSAVTAAMAPSKDKRMSVLFIKPMGHHDVKDLYQVMDDPNQVEQLISTSSNKYCRLVIPKFTVESDLEMTEGIKKAIPSFNGGTNLSGVITGHHGPIQMDKFIQKTVFECCEKGCEGAAATMARWVNFSCSTPPPEVVFNTPFVFMMIDNATKHVLFSGIFAKKGAALVNKPNGVGSVFRPLSTQKKKEGNAFVKQPVFGQTLPIATEFGVGHKNKTIEVAPPSFMDTTPNYEARLATFRDWPTRGKPSAKDLAKAGFIYVGGGDTTMCVKCKTNVENWEAFDVPVIEHARHYAACPSVREVFTSEELGLLQRTLTLMGEEDLNRLATLFKSI